MLQHKTQKKKEREMAKAARRARIAELYLSGVTNYMEIARQVGLKIGASSNQVIMKDLKSLRELWKIESVRDFDEAKGLELAKIDRVEAELWKAWESSKKPVYTRRVKKERTINTSPSASGSRFKMIPTEKEVRKEEKAGGDPRYMNLILQCVDRRCELLALITKPGSTDLTTTPPVVGFRIFNPAEKTTEKTGT